MGQRCTTTLRTKHLWPAAWKAHAWALMCRRIIMSLMTWITGDLLQPGDERPQLRKNVQAWPLARPGRPGLGTEQRIPPTTQSISSTERIRNALRLRTACDA